MINFYVTLKELKKGGRECEVQHSKPNEEFVSVVSDDSAFAGRGKNAVIYKGEELAWEFRHAARGEDDYDAHEPSIGLLSNALEAALELGII